MEEQKINTQEIQTAINTRLTMLENQRNVAKEVDDILMVGVYDKKIETLKWVLGLFN